jgi:hypothetical protein
MILANAMSKAVQTVERNTEIIRAIQAVRALIQAEVVFKLVRHWAGPGLVGEHAVALRNEKTIELIIDWKSDIDPDPSGRSAHVGQMWEYLKAANCSRGAINYMTTGVVHEVHGGILPSPHVGAR